MPKGKTTILASDCLQGGKTAPILVFRACGGCRTITGASPFVDSRVPHICMRTHDSMRACTYLYAVRIGTMHLCKFSHGFLVHQWGTISLGCCLHMSVVRRRGPLLSRAHILRRDLGFCNRGVWAVAGGEAADLVASEAGGRASMLPPV